MNAHLFIDLIIYLNIYCAVWAQTVNNETTTQLPGNTEPLALEMTQTPKTGDNRTEYENTTTIETNELDSNDKNPIDLVSINNTFMTTTVTTAVTPKAIKLSEISTEAMESEPTTTAVGPIDTTNSHIDQENETSLIDSGNPSSQPIEVNEGEEHQTTTVWSVLSTTHTSMVSTQPNDSTESPQSLSTNITTILTQFMKTSKAMNFSDESSDERNDSLNYISDANNQTISKTWNASEESYVSSTESSAINSMSGDNTTTTLNMTQNSLPASSSSPQMIGTTQLNEINSRQTIETSTHKPSAETTQGIQTTTNYTFISSDSMPKIEESEQITEIPINSSESHTVADHHYISSIPVLSDTPINQNRQNQTLFENSTDIPQNTNTNASEINSTAPVGGEIASHEPQVHTIPKLSTISTSEETHNWTDWMQITNIEEKQRETQTTPQRETERPITTTTVSPSTQSVRQFSETQRQSKSEAMERETNPLIELLQTSASTTTHPKPTTHIPNHSTLTLNSSEPTVRLTESPTQFESSETQRESQMTTEPKIGVLAANDSEPSIDSETTLNQPLTDHSLKTTQYIKPMTTSTPLESNISAITVTLPNIKYISSISKEDMVNIVTITFIAKSIDIFRWVSLYDQIFRNFTCSRIDPEMKWCSIDRFIYLSPSPVVVDNHMIINFVINDSTDTDLNGYHIFGGPLIVEALKNSTSSLETMMAMKVMSLQTNLGTMVVKPLDNSPERLAKFELLVFIFTVVMFICTALLCLAVICSCAKRKSVDMNQIHLSNAGRRHTTHTPLNGGFDLNSASNILRDENQEKLNHNVINLDGWVAPIEQVDNEKMKYDNLEDTKL